MPGPPPKAAGERRRRNKVAGSRVLAVVSSDEVEIPSLLLDGAHPMTVSWWRDIWSSPMSSEFDRSDIHGLLILAVLVDAFWRKPSRELAGEIRLQRQAFGLTPLDRRRLQWEIDRGDEAVERTAARAKAKRPKAVKDPRVANAGKQGTTARRRPSA